MACPLKRRRGDVMATVAADAEGAGGAERGPCRAGAAERGVGAREGGREGEKEMRERGIGREGLRKSKRAWEGGTRSNEGESHRKGSRRRYHPLIILCA